QRSPHTCPFPPSPTRRSSDLRLLVDLDREGLDAVDDTERGPPRLAPHGDVGEAAVVDGEPGRVAVPHAGEVQRRLRGGPRAEGADRKSTRLNSSHVKISYAVF